MIDTFIARIRRAAMQDFTLFGLRTVIIAWSILVIFLALTIKNKWVLTGILAYEILP